MKAERVYRLVLPGLCAWSPCEEGPLHAWMGGFGCQTVEWGGEEDDERCAACLATPNNTGQVFLLSESGRVVPLLTRDAAPRGPLRGRGGSPTVLQPVCTRQKSSPNRIQRQ